MQLGVSKDYGNEIDFIVQWYIEERVVRITKVSSILVSMACRIFLALSVSTSSTVSFLRVSRPR